MAELNNLKNQYSFGLDDEFSNNSEPSKEKNIKLISIGNCSKFYFYILGSALFKFCSIIILTEIGNNNGLFGFVPILSFYGSMQSIYTYLSYIIFGTIFQFCSKRKDRDENKYNTLNTIHIKIINRYKNKTNLKFILTCFSFTIYSEIQNLLFSFGYDSLDFWTFELIFVFILMKKYFEFDIYRHHKCSIISIIIICTILLFIATFLPNFDSKMESQYEYVKNELGSYFYSIPIMFIFIIISFIYGFSRTYSKILMQSKYISKFILIIFIGIAGLITTITISIIFYFLEKDNFFAYFMELKNHTTWEILRDVLIITPLFMFFQFMQIFLEILIIYYLNPVFCLLLNNICYGTRRLIFFLIDINMEYLASFILMETSEIVSLFGYIINLEIIELNFCGLSDNTRRNIMNKSEYEFNKLRNDNKTLDEDEEEEDNIFIEFSQFERLSEMDKKNIN